MQLVPLHTGTYKRPVPLEHVLYFGGDSEKDFYKVGEREAFLPAGYKAATDALNKSKKPSSSSGGSGGGGGLVAAGGGRGGAAGGGRGGGRDGGGGRGGAVHVESS
jgi:antiviral helicase SKI2